MVCQRLAQQKQSLAARQSLPYMVCVSVWVVAGGGRSKTCVAETVPGSKTRSTIQGGGGGRGSSLSKTWTTETVPDNMTRPTIHGVCVGRGVGGDVGVAGGLLKTCTTETVPGSKTRSTIHCAGGEWGWGCQRPV